MAENNGAIKKIFLIMLYLIIIILIPLFLDYLFKITTREKRRQKLINLALERAKLLNKSLIIFTGRYCGVVVDAHGKNLEKFDGDILRIVDDMADDSCVIMVDHVLEYLDHIQIKKLLRKLIGISGKNLYILAIEKNPGFRIFWDYKIKNIMENSFYLPDCLNIKWQKLNNLQRSTHKIYQLVFKIIPYSLFSISNNYNCVVPKI